MAKLIIWLDDQLVQEVELNKERITLGRHPGNDVVLAKPTVSGRHAAISHSAGGAVLEDLGSTNGTRMGGRRIARHLLADGDRITIAQFSLQYVAGPAPLRKSAVPLPLPAVLASDVPLPNGRIEVLTGNNAGKVLALVKPLTTLGSPGVSVLVISRAAAGFGVAHIDGPAVPTVNGEPLGKTPRPLADGDVLELSGTRMAFHGEPAAPA